MSVDIEQYCDEWLRIRKNSPKNFTPKTQSEWRKSLNAQRSIALKGIASAVKHWEWKDHLRLNVWFSEALSHSDKKWFVVDLFSIGILPNSLFKDMLMAGVLERNPSANRVFIEVCIKHRGLKSVLELLIHYIKYGSNIEKAGAIQARYWATHNCLNEDIDDLKLKFKSLVLDEFIQNEDVSVRTNIVPFLELEAYPDFMREKFFQAARIARDHESEYIRHRIKLQLKDEDALKENGLLMVMAKPTK